MSLFDVDNSNIVSKLRFFPGDSYPQVIREQRNREVRRALGNLWRLFIWNVNYPLKYAVFFFLYNMVASIVCGWKIITFTPPHVRLTTKHFLLHQKYVVLRMKSQFISTLSWDLKQFEKKTIFSLKRIKWQPIDLWRMSPGAACHIDKSIATVHHQ